MQFGYDLFCMTNEILVTDRVYNNIQIIVPNSSILKTKLRLRKGQWKSPWVLVEVQFFETSLPLVESLWCALQDGLCRCWGPVLSFTMVSILAAVLNFTQN